MRRFSLCTARQDDVTKWYIVARQVSCLPWSNRGPNEAAQSAVSKLSKQYLPGGTSRPSGAAARSRFPALSFSRCLVLGALVLLSACGGGGAVPPDGGTGTPPADNGPALSAPAALAYAEPEALYLAGDAITANLPTGTGGDVDSYTITPALPAGLELDARTGAIRGTPTAVSAYASYTVTGSNAAGAASATVRIEVTARGSWASAGTFGTPRRSLTASLLQDGRVLAAGGSSGGGSIVHPEVDVYDPALGTWTPVWSMLSPRAGHTATVLADGRVLVAGGEIASNTTTASAELYDPATGFWSPTGAMAHARSFHTATLLPSGQVLVLGGSQADPGGTIYPDTAEAYDPVTGTWATLATRLAGPRTLHTAELLAGGTQVLVAGGSNSGGMASAELFPVSGGTSVVLPGGPRGVAAHSVSLADGSVLVTTHDTTAWRFDPATSSWRSSTLAAGRMLSTLTRLADGRALVAGDQMSSTAEIYNPGVNRWTPAAPMATTRAAAAATRLQDGSVLAIGGVNMLDVGTAERYRP